MFLKANQKPGERPTDRIADRPSDYRPGEYRPSDIGGLPDLPRPSQTGKPGVPSIISPDLRINGDLVCSGDIQIDGWVEGDIRSRSVTIGESATVQGAIHAETVRVCGLINGTINADTVILEKTARVTGDVLHKSLAIEQGAFLEGMCRRIESRPTPVEVEKAPAADLAVAG